MTNDNEAPKRSRRDVTSRVGLLLLIAGELGILIYMTHAWPVFMLR